MIFHENRLLLADDSHVISCLIFFENFLSAAVVIGALRVKQMREKMTVVVDGGKRIDIDNYFTRMTMEPYS